MRHGRRLVAIRSALSLARKVHQLTRKTDAHLLVEPAVYTGHSSCDLKQTSTAPSFNVDQDYDDGFSTDSDTNLSEMLNVRLPI